LRQLEWFPFHYGWPAIEQPLSPSRQGVLVEKADRWHDIEAEIHLAHKKRSQAQANLSPRFRNRHASLRINFGDRKYKAAHARQEPTFSWFFGYHSTDEL
jgi:hypothetical protein